MTMPVAPIKIVYGVRLFAEAVHAHVGQLTLLAVPSMNYPLALLPLLEDHPEAWFFALPSVGRVASIGNYTYSVSLEEYLSKRLVTSRRDGHRFEKLPHSTSVESVCETSVTHLAALSRQPYSSIQAIENFNLRECRTTSKTPSSQTHASDPCHITKRLEWGAQLKFSAVLKR